MIFLVMDTLCKVAPDDLCFLDEDIKLIIEKAI